MQIHETRLNTWGLIALSTALSVGIFVVCLLLAGKGIIAALLKIGLIVTMINGLWRLTDSYLWRRKWVRSLFFSGIPDLNGRWEGEIHREGEQTPHAFALEIRQSLTKIHIDGYSPSGAAGPSVTARICEDDSHQQYYVVYMWTCETPNTIFGSPSGWFYGTTILKWLPSMNLQGTYFTGRTPHQTRGKAHFAYAGPTLKGTF